MMDKYIKYIQYNVDESEIASQVMEECGELIQAINKYRRATTGKNPTPVLPAEALSNLRAEIIDVIVSLMALDEEEFYFLLREAENSPKWQRWAKRLGYKG